MIGGRAILFGGFLLVNIGGGGGGGSRSSSSGSGRIEVEVADIGQRMAGHDDMAGQLEFTLGLDLILDQVYPVTNVGEFR